MWQAGNLGVIKVDDAGLIKLNSLATGKLDIPASAGIFKKNEVPYNKLLDRGYKSVADWHSTKPIAEGEDERAEEKLGWDTVIVKFEFLHNF